MKKFLLIFLSLSLITYISVYSYNKNKETKANNEIKKILLQNSNTLNEGIALMKLGNYEEAINKFKSIPEIEESSTKIKECELLIENKKIEEIKIDIENNKFEEAKLSIQSIINSSNLNSETLQSLLKTCDNGINNLVTENKRQALLKTITGTYKLLVDTNAQEVYVYKNNTIIKTMICSSGIKGKSTPTGKFTITDRGEYFYSDKYSQGAYYWVRFHGVYLFHSVPTDKSGTIIKEEAEKLGEKASHGCVRLSLENAKWIYDNIPKNISKVIVY